MSESLDPAGHIKLSVSNFDRSKLFYSGLFNILGFTQIAEKDVSAGWVTKHGLGIWIAQAEKPGSIHELGAVGLHHICLKANSPKDVDDVYSYLLDTETQILSAPKPYPEYIGLTQKPYKAPATVRSRSHEAVPPLSHRSSCLMLVPSSSVPSMLVYRD